MSDYRGLICVFAPIRGLYLIVDIPPGGFPCVTADNKGCDH